MLTNILYYILYCCTQVQQIPSLRTRRVPDLEGYNNIRRYTYMAYGTEILSSTKNKLHIYTQYSLHMVGTYIVLGVYE